MIPGAVTSSAPANRTGLSAGRPRGGGAHAESPSGWCAGMGISAEGSPQGAVTGALQKRQGAGLRALAAHGESRIKEGTWPRTMRMLRSVLPQYAMSQVVGYSKGRSAIHRARVCGERKQSYVGKNFGARGSLVSLWEGAKQHFETTSGRRSGKRIAGIEWTCGADLAPAGGTTKPGSRRRPRPAARRGSHHKGPQPYWR